MKKWDRVEEKGFRFESFEYDGDAQMLQRNLERKGYEVKLLREATDTRGLKMYSVWKKGER